MKAVDPGHEYHLDCLDADIPTVEILHFVKRIGDKFPGNHPPARQGTTTQEVIRALIDRTKYVDSQIHYDDNDQVIKPLRFALCYLEHRAALARDDRRAAIEIWAYVDQIETLEV